MRFRLVLPETREALKRAYPVLNEDSAYMSLIKYLMLETNYASSLSKV